MSDNTQEEKLSPIYDSVVDMVLMGITGNNTLEFSPDGEGYNAPTLRASNGIVRIYDRVRTYSPPVAQVTLDTITGIALDSGEPLTWSGETISSGWGYVPIENPILRALLKATHPSAAIYDVTAGMITLLIPAPTPHPNKVIRVVVIDSSNPKNYQPQSDFRGGYQEPSNNRGYQTQSHSRELPVRSSNTQYHRSTAFIDRVPTNPYLQYSSAYGMYRARTAIDKLKHKPGDNSMVDTTPLLPKDLVELEYLYKGILAYLLSGPSNLDEYLRKYLTSEQLTTLEFFATWLHQFGRDTSYPIIVSLIVGTYKDLGWSSSDVESAYDKLRDLIASINEAIVLTKCKHREAVKSASLNDTIQVDSQQEPYTLGEIISDIHGYLIYGNSSGAIEELRKHLKDEQVANLVQFKGWLEGQSNYTADTVRTCLNEQAMSILARTNKLRDNTDIDRLNLAVDIICKTMRGFMSILKVEISTLSGVKSGDATMNPLTHTTTLWRGKGRDDVIFLRNHLISFINGGNGGLYCCEYTGDEIEAIHEMWGSGSALCHVIKEVPSHPGIQDPVPDVVFFPKVDDQPAARLVSALVAEMRDFVLGISARYPGLQSSTVVKDTGKLWRDTLKVEEVNRLYVHIADYLSGKPDVDLRLAPATVDEVVCLNAVRVYWGAACKDLGPDIHNYPLLSQLTAMLGLLADGMPDSFKLRDRKHYQEVVHSFGAVISLIKEMTNFINGEVSSI